MTFWDYSTSFEPTWTRKRHAGHDWFEQFPDLTSKDARLIADFRAELIDRARKSASFAYQVREACSRDLLFWINATCWLLEPRRTDGPNVFPFITWQMQDWALTEMAASLGVEDVLVDKSRATGASWMVLHLFYWDWAFHRQCHYGVVSNDEDAVDNADDPDALMQKLDFIFEHQPWFLQPKLRRTHLKFKNLDTRSTIIGYPATGNVGRGGRKKAFLMDEFHDFKPGDDYKALSSTQFNTNCRFFVSTITGLTGAYYDIARGGTNLKMKHLILDWADIPEQRAGLYRYIDGRIKKFDPGYRYAADYNFILDGKTRSPWADEQCRRPGATRQSIARELYRDAGAAGSTFLDVEALDKARHLSAREPLAQGRLDYDLERCIPEWVRRPGGPLSIWCPVDLHGQVERDDYIIGIDIAAGTGGDTSSNSAAFVFRNSSGEQVAEYVTMHENPTRFACTCLALALWFHKAYLVPEANGPVGQTFMKELLRRKYPNIHYRIQKHVRSEKKTSKPGWWNDDESLPAALAEWGRAVECNELIVRSAQTLNEAKHYVYRDGKVKHERATDTEDDSAKGKSHGDRCVASVLAWVGRRDRPPKKIENNPEKWPPGCMALRLKEYDERLALATADTDFDF